MSHCIHSSTSSVNSMYGIPHNKPPLLCSVQILLSPPSFNSFQCPPFFLFSAIVLKCSSHISTSCTGRRHFLAISNNCACVGDFPSSLWWNCCNNVEGGCLIAGRVDFKSCSGSKNVHGTAHHMHHSRLSPKVAEGQARAGTKHMALHCTTQGVLQGCDHCKLDEYTLAYSSIPTQMHTVLEDLVPCDHFELPKSSQCCHFPVLRH